MWILPHIANLQTARPLNANIALTWSSVIVDTLPRFHPVDVAHFEHTVYR